MSAIASTFVDLVYTNEVLQLYLLIIGEQQQFPGLGEPVYRSGPEAVLPQLSTTLDEPKARGILSNGNIEISSRLFLAC